MKILIIQTAFIGDVVLATALIEKLKETHPDCTIDFLLKKGNESLFTHHPHIKKIYVFNKKKNKYRNLIRLIKEIRSASYDYTINLHRFFSTGLITILSGSQTTIGFDKNPLSFLFTTSVKHHISQSDLQVHEVNRNLSLILSITGNNEFKRPRLYPSENDYTIVPAHGEYVCIAPSSVWYTKQFPVHKWSELITHIPTQYKIYLIGSSDDIKLCEDIKKRSDPHRVEILAGKLTFLQSAALIDKARMTFANDSAPLHFASAMNAPITGIFCSTTPAFGFGPLSDISYTVEVAEKLECRPCGLHGKKQCPLEHFKCADIDVVKILMKAQIL